MLWCRLPPIAECGGTRQKALQDCGRFQHLAQNCTLKLLLRINGEAPPTFMFVVSLTSARDTRRVHRFFHEWSCLRLPFFFLRAVPAAVKIRENTSRAHVSRARFRIRLTCARHSPPAITVSHHNNAIVAARPKVLFLTSLSASSYTSCASETSMDNWLDELLLMIRVIACCASFAACASLLIMLSRGAAGIRNRLFPTQLRCLATVDMFFVLSAAPFLMSDAHPNFSPEAMDVICRWTNVFFTLFRHLSQWMEMHIAVSFALQSFKVRSLTFMYRGLPCVCAPCLGLTLLSAFLSPWGYDCQESACIPLNRTEVADPVVVAGFFLCLSVCLSCYLVVVCRSRRRQSPYSVQARVCARTEMYISNVLVTYGPVFVIYLHPSFFNIGPLYSVASVFEFSGGLLNTLTYALQSRYAAALSGGPSPIRAEIDNSGGRVTYSPEIVEGELSLSECTPRCASAMNSNVQSDSRWLQCTRTVFFPRG